MFAQEEMLGQEIVSMDHKRRIGLPAFTYREKGDTVVIIVDVSENLVELMSPLKLSAMYHQFLEQNDTIYLKKFYEADFSKRVVDAQN